MRRRQGCFLKDRVARRSAARTHTHLASPGHRRYTRTKSQTRACARPGPLQRRCPPLQYRTRPSPGCVSPRRSSVGSQVAPGRPRVPFTPEHINTATSRTRARRRECHLLRIKRAAQRPRQRRRPTRGAQARALSGRRPWSRPGPDRDRCPMPAAPPISRPASQEEA